MISRLSSDNAQVLEELKTTSRWLLTATLTGLGLILLRFFVGSAFSVYHHQGWVIQGKVFTSLLWAMGWFAIAFVFGFIFGIPKVPPTTSPAKPDSTGTHTASSTDSTSSVTPSRFRPNTNLEEISDWLTKILVGATLTQLGKVPGLVKSAAEYMATDVAEPSYETFAASILLYFSSIGFLAGYILTRAYFSRQFERSAQAPLFTQEDKDALKNAPLAIGLDTRVPTEVQQLLAKSSEVPITDALSGPEAAAIATAALLNGDNSRALHASSLALTKAPQDARSHLNYALALYNINPQQPEIMQQLETARKLIDDPKSDPRTAEDVCNSIVYLALYLPPPQGFEKAIEYGESYIEEVKPRSSSLFINLACAYGQKHEYLKQKDPEQANAARAKALEYVNAAKKAEPDSIHRLRELYHGNGQDPQDSDLKTFEGDAEFEKALAATP